jgi:hypothetical protein
MKEYFDAEKIRPSTFVALSAFFAVGFLSCAPWQDEYLRQAVNGATQEDVTQELGPPEDTRSFENGESVWLYREKGKGNQVYAYGAGGIFCEEYRLTFDAGKILRQWERDRCS